MEGDAHINSINIINTASIYGLQGSQWQNDLAQNGDSDKMETAFSSSVHFS